MVTGETYDIDSDGCLVMFCSNRLMLLYQVQEGGTALEMIARWSVFDLQTRTSKQVEVDVEITSLLVSHQMPYLSAYALTQSPWHKSGRFFCFSGKRKLYVQHVD